MSSPKARVVAIGEVLIEMARGGDGRFAVGCGGDTFNTAVYLARAGIPTAFATALGDDPFSDRILALATAEGVQSDLMLRVPGRLPGIYVIDGDAAGKRTFHYWRDGEPASRIVRARGLGPHRREPCSRPSWCISPASRCRSIPTPRSAVSWRSSRWRGSTARRSRSTAISGRAAGRATSRARARCSWKRSSASTSRCRPMTTKRCCGATRRRRRRSSACRRSASARSS